MPHFISIVKALDLTTPALLFPAISLLLLAYTNRFLSYASVVRNLKDKYENNPKLAPKSREQIDNLLFRLRLTRWMQTLGASSLGLSVIAMFFIYIGWGVMAHILFGIGMLMLFASLVLCIWEIQCSVRAIELHIGQLPKSHSGGDVLAHDAQNKQRSITEAQERKAQEQAQANQQAKRKQSVPTKGKAKPESGSKSNVDVDQDPVEAKVEAQPAAHSKKQEHKPKSTVEPKLIDQPKPEVEVQEASEANAEDKSQRTSRRTRGRGPARLRAEQAIQQPQGQTIAPVANIVEDQADQVERLPKAVKNAPVADRSEAVVSTQRADDSLAQGEIPEQRDELRQPRRVRSRRRTVKLEDNLGLIADQVNIGDSESDASATDASSRLLEAEPNTIEIGADVSMLQGRPRRRRPRSNRVALVDMTEEVGEVATPEAVAELSPEVAPFAEEVSEVVTPEAVAELSPEVAPLAEEVSEVATPEAVAELSPEVAPLAEEVSEVAPPEAVAELSPEVAPLAEEVSEVATPEVVAELSPDVAPLAEEVSEVATPEVVAELSPDVAPLAEEVSEVAPAEVSEEATVPTTFVPVVDELKGELLRILNK